MGDSSFSWWGLVSDLVKVTVISGGATPQAPRSLWRDSSFSWWGLVSDLVKVTVIFGGATPQAPRSLRRVCPSRGGVS